MDPLLSFSYKRVPDLAAYSAPYNTLDLLSLMKCLTPKGGRRFRNWAPGSRMLSH